MLCWGRNFRRETFEECFTTSLKCFQKNKNNTIAITSFSKKNQCFLSNLKETYTSVRIKFPLNAYVGEEI